MVVTLDLEQMEIRMSLRRDSLSPNSHRIQATAIVLLSPNDMTSHITPCQKKKKKVNDLITHCVTFMA